MRIPKMFLKHSFSHSKWVLQEILFLTVLSNCFSGISHFDTSFLPDCTNVCSAISGYWIRTNKKFNEDFKNVLKQFYRQFLSLAVVSNCVFGSPNFVLFKNEG